MTHKPKFVATQDFNPLSVFLEFKGKTCNNESMEEIKNTATFCDIRHKGRIWKSVHTWSIHFITATTNRNYSLLKIESESH